MLFHRSNVRAVLKIGAAFSLSIAFSLVVLGLTADAACDVDKGQARPPAPAPRIEPRPIVPFVYAQTAFPTVPVYANPADELAGIPPVRVLGTGFVWMSLADRVPLSVNSSLWYHINPDGYVRAETLKFIEPSAFHGVTVAAQPARAFGWIIFGTRTSAAPGLAPTKNSNYLAKYSNITVLDEKQAGNWTWYKVADSQWVEQRQVGIVRTTARPPGVGQFDKWIEVNLFEQTLAAYEGDQMVYATLVSSGLDKWPTPTGLFQVWAKVTDWKMSGKEGLPDYYYLEDVPWILYFNKDVALHAAYWHDKFGARHSHGCVNLSPADAKWLFDWATPAQGPNAWTLANPENPGTWVWVH